MYIYMYIYIYIYICMYINILLIYIYNFKATIFWNTLQGLIQKEKAHIDCEKGAQINILANKI